MKVTFSVSHQYDDKYAVKYIVTVPGKGNMSFVSIITYKDFRLSSLVSKAHNSVYARIYSLRKQGHNLPKEINIEWDEAVADLPDSLKRQYKAQGALFTSATQESQEPALLEVVKINDVWTIRVHETPLLTWAEACKLLKEKVDNNGK